MMRGVPTIESVRSTICDPPHSRHYHRPWDSGRCRSGSDVIVIG